MKKAFVFLVLIALIASVNAMTVSTPGRIPTGTAWDFELGLNAPSAFDSTKIFVDQEQLLTIFSDGSFYSEPSIFPPSQEKVLNVFLKGNKLFVVTTGLAAGNHAIKAESFQGGEKTDSISVSVEAVTTLSGEYQKQVEGQLNNLKNATTSLQNSINSLQQNSATKTQIQGMQNSLNQINESIDSLENELQESEEQASSLQETTANTITEIHKRVDYLEAEPADDSSLVTGFVAAAKVNFWYIVAAGIIIGLGIFFLFKDKLSENESNPFMPDEGRPPEETGNPFKESSDNELIEDIVAEGKRGKWSTD